MKAITWTALILCSFGFMREMRPSESFMAEYLTGSWRNVSFEHVNQVIYPMGTYSYLAQLVIIFLITDILRYKPIIVLSAICGTIMMGLYSWTSSYWTIVCFQLIQGTFMSSEVAYYTYMYAKVDKKVYEKVSAHTRSAMHLGRFTAGGIAQLLMTYKVLDARELHIVSFGSQVISIILAILLPNVSSSLYFFSETERVNGNLGKLDETIEINGVHGKMDGHENEAQLKEINYKLDKNGAGDTEAKLSLGNAISLMKSHLITAYTNNTVICWSIWWVLATAGFSIVLSYIQLLWKTVEDTSPYNGAVDGIQTLCSAIGAFSAGFINTDKFRRWDLYVLTVFSILEGLILIWGAMTCSIWVAYLSYILFIAFYNFMITIASAIVAKRLPEDSFALIFGINSLFALIIQVVMTVIFVSDKGFALSTRGQYMAYGYYFLVFAAVYAITGVVIKLRAKYCKKS